MLYVVLTVLLWGVTPVLDKVASLHADAMAIVFMRTVGILVASLIIVIAGGKIPAIQETLAQSSPKVLACMLSSGIIAGCLGVYTFMRSLQEVGDAGKVAVLTSTYPLVALVLTVVLLGEKLTAAKIGGSLLITLGVALLYA